jgi:hypothetical protein
MVVVGKAPVDRKGYEHEARWALQRHATMAHCIGDRQTEKRARSQRAARDSPDVMVLRKEVIEREYEPLSDSGPAGSPPPGGSRLRGKNEPSGMRGSSSLGRGPGARPFAALRVRVRVFSTFFSFLAGTVPLALLGTRPNSSRMSVLCLCALRGEEVVRVRENRLGIGRRSKAKAKGGTDNRRSLAVP